MAKNQEEADVWWQDLLWGLWNGLTAWIVMIVHFFHVWQQYPFYDEVRSGNWYDLGFVIGAASPILWPFGAKARSRR